MTFTEYFIDAKSGCGNVDYAQNHKCLADAEEVGGGAEKWRHYSKESSDYQTPDRQDGGSYVRRCQAVDVVLEHGGGDAAAGVEEHHYCGKRAAVGRKAGKYEGDRQRYGAEPNGAFGPEFQLYAVGKKRDCAEHEIERCVHRSDLQLAEAQGGQAERVDPRHG